MAQQGYQTRLVKFVVSTGSPMRLQNTYCIVPVAGFAAQRA